MATLRTFEDQFEAPKVRQIRELLSRIKDLRMKLPEGATHYYFVELAATLEVGALLASLHLAASALELFVRALIIDRVSIADSTRSYSTVVLTYQERLEEDRKLGFGKMLDHLVSVGLFRSADATLSKTFYEEVRIPLLHGLLERFMSGRPNEAESLLRLFGPGGFTNSREFEKAIEDQALNHIETTIGIVERNVDV